MRKLLSFAFVFLSAFALGQTTAVVTGNLVGQSETGTSSGISVDVTLVNTGSQRCFVNGTGTVVTEKNNYTAAQILAGITLAKTANITCGTSSGQTRWRFSFKNSTLNTSRDCDLQISGATSLNTATCLQATTTPTTTVPTASLFWLLDGSNSPTGNLIPAVNGTQSIGTSGSRWNMFANTMDVSGNETVGGTLSASAYNTVRIMVEQQAGSDMGAKINACISALPAAGGICDAKSLQGSQSAAATVTCNKAGVLVVLGSVTLALSGSPGWNASSDHCSMWGQGPFTTNITTKSATADVIQLNGLWSNVQNLAIFTDTSVVTRTAGAGINFLNSHAFVADLVINNTFYGMQFGTTAGSAEFVKHVEMGYFGAPSGGNWQAGIQIGPSPGGTCCIASNKFSDININAGTAGFADAAVVIDSAADTMEFSNLDIALNTVGAAFTALHLKDTTGRKPEWLFFTNSSFEGSGSGVGVQADSCRHCYFVNSALSGAGAHAITVGANVIDFSATSGFIVNSQQECATIANGAAGVDISHNRIGDCGQQTNNTYSSISVAANATDVKITDNTFASITLPIPTNIPSNNVNIAAGTGNRIWVTGNTFGNNSGTALVNGATGTDVYTYGNSGGGNSGFGNLHPLIVPDGSVSAPGWGFSSTNSSGFFRLASGIPQVAANGVAGPYFANVGIGLGSAMLAAWGSTTDPAGSGADTGLSRVAAGVVGVGTGAAGNTSGTIKPAAILSGGTAATLTGTGACATFSTQTGGSMAGRATCTGTTGASTLTITPGTTATNGWACYVQDQTTRANLLQQTSTTTGACTLTATSVTQNDVFVFTALAF